MLSRITGEAFKSLCNLCFVLFNSLVASSLMLIVFTLNHNQAQNFLSPYICNELLKKYIFEFIPECFITYFIFIMLVIACILASFVILKILALGFQGEEISEAELRYVSNASWSYIPIYLSYCFVALSIDKCEVFVCIYLLVAVLTSKSQTVFFNPFFLLCGRHFYFLELKKQCRVMLITHNTYKSPQEIEHIQVTRLNDFTFLEVKK